MTVPKDESTKVIGLSSAVDEVAALARVAAGDRVALRQLYLEYHRRLHRFLMRVTRDPGLAEELVNDTMLTVWRSAGAFRGESRVSTWIMGIAYHRALKALESARRRLPSGGAAGGDAVDPSLDGVDAIDALAHNIEMRDWIDSALGCLTAEHRLTLEMAYFLGLSCEEIAEVSDCPVGTVKTRLHYARQRLHASLVTLSGTESTP